jgi:hypothetical protein
MRITLSASIAGDRQWATQKGLVGLQSPSAWHQPCYVVYLPQQLLQRPQINSITLYTHTPPTLKSLTCSALLRTSNNSIWGESLPDSTVSAHTACAGVLTAAVQHRPLSSMLFVCHTVVTLFSCVQEDHDVYLAKQQQLQEEEEKAHQCLC